ncbi:hypothetical protein [Parachlamydia acanthamoebae]|jgi:hypothetical protein|uniref:hypothetical protein n=1 Tax=Parachlamydia acanthamoebae TaxID=83552 RepID=UPI0001C174F0|nr:hypothetical protein [Parachlamydia acanthamoebae]EFB41135.1 hypothetical protein pah_c050o107 [Parachlamydia acanthamoebae str. Hall's coccus]
MHPLSRVPQKIIPTDKIAFTQKLDGQWIASQKGVMGGRSIKIDLNLKDKPSQKKIKELMKQAFKEGSSLARQITNEETSVQYSLKKYPIDICLTIEGPAILAPPYTAAKIQDRNEGLLAHLYARFTGVFKSFLASSDGNVALSAGHLSKGAHPSEPVKIVQNLIDSEMLDLQLHSNAPSNFFEAHSQYNKDISLLHHLFSFPYKKNLSRMDRLKEHECVLFSMPGEGHMMMAMAIKQNDGLFTFYLANSGLKADHYHHKKYNARGERIYQQVYVIEDIPKENLKDFIKFYLKSKNSKRDRIVKMYEEMQRLGVSKNVDDSRFWNTAQVGGSCAGDAEKAMLRAVLSKESYSKLKAHLDTHNAFKLYKLISSKTQTSYLTKVGLLEIVKILQSKKLNQEMGDALEQIKQKTEKQIHKSKALHLPSKLKKIIFKDYANLAPPFKEPDDLLKRVCFLIADGKYDEAHAIILQLYSLPFVEEANESERLVVRNIMALYKHDTVRSRELLNLYYGLSKVIVNRGIHLVEEEYALDQSIGYDYTHAKIQKFYPEDPWVFSNSNK